MDQGVILILLSGVMLIGSFLSGSIPIIMNMSEDKIQVISVMGAGLLVGTALTIIIPEGIRTLYMAYQESLSKLHSHDKGTVGAGPHNLPLDPSVKTLGNEDEESDPFSTIGLCLVSGFIFMLLIDECSRSRSRDLESGVGGPKKSFTATIGLVVHAAADGVALGAAATTPHPEIEMIIFVAIMLHKAPAAFGLVTFLLRAGLERNRVRRHLVIFSLAAPIMAIITYFGISQEGKESLSKMNGTGIAMLFSAGTFLYVTVHVLLEVTKDSHSGLSRRELVLLVIGAFLPIFLTSGHHH